MLAIFKRTYFYGFLLCALALTVVYYGENVLGLHPCALCYLQRWCVWIIGGVFLLLLMCPCSVCCCILKWLNCLVILFGGSVAIRQLWLEYHPVSEHLACAPSLERLFSVHSFFTAIEKALTTTQYCSKNIVKVLGASLAHWSLALFVMLLVIVVIECKSNKECKLFRK